MSSFLSHIRRNLSALSLVVTVICACGGGAESTSVTTTPVVPVTPPAPVKYLQVATSDAYSCGLRTDRTLVCWGYDGRYAPLPDNLPPIAQIAATAYGPCVLLTTGTVQCLGTANDPLGVRNVPAGLGGITQLAGGNSHVCAYGATAGVVCWGYKGSLDASVSDKLKTVDSLSAGGGSGDTCAIVQGHVTCWGATWAPVPSNLSGVVQVASGLRHSCAVVSGGTVTCWGDNSASKLYDFTRAAGLSGVVAIGVSSNRRCAILLDKSVQCWGTPIMANLKFALPAGLQLTAISSGQYHMCGIKPDQTAVCFGESSSGELIVP
jgi:hypothetical protein